MWLFLATAGILSCQQLSGKVLFAFNQTKTNEVYMFNSSMVALITPMNDDGSVDFEALAGLIELHIECGTDALVVMGTTGESATLSASDAMQVIEFSVTHVAGRIPVIAGTYAAATQQVIEKTTAAMQANVDACLIMTPAYIKPTQEGLYEHYKAIAKACAIPQIIYNVPSRTACDIQAATVERLAHISNIIGIKEATGDMARAQEILSRCGDSLNLYSGDDATALALMMLGGKGVISVTANVVPRMMKQMCSAALTGDYARALMLNEKLMPLHRQLFVEANPIPVKWCLAEMGLIKNVIRLPLTTLAMRYHESLRAAMRSAEINHL